MGAGATIYIPSFRKIDSDLQGMFGGGRCTHTDIQTHRQQVDLKCLHLFFQNKGSMVKIDNCEQKL
jgi:hypothetical protein